MGLRHVVITSVTRDDLADGGAQHFAETIRAVREAVPSIATEVLTSDFAGREESVDVVLARDVPAMGVAIVDGASPPTGFPPATRRGRTLSNGILEATIDESGRITRLLHIGSGRDAVGERGGGGGPLNQLVLYDDRP